MTISVAINEVSAICNLGDNWPQIWNSLLVGQRSESQHRDVSYLIPVNAQVAVIDGLKRSVEADSPTGWGAASRLVQHVLLEPSLCKAGENVAYFCGTNHGESDVITEIVSDVIGKSETLRTARLFGSLMRDPLPCYSIQQSTHSASSGIWIYSACTSGLHALALGFLHLQRLRKPNASAVIVAADALSALGVAGFKRAGAIAAQGCVPFSLASDGLLVGEGAAAVRLSACMDNRHDLAVLGIGMSCDSAHPTRPMESGCYLSKAIERALSSARIPRKNIGAVITHGTGTPANDDVEVRVLSSLFSSCRPPVTSIKGLTGHCMGASGLLNVLCAISALHTGLLPPISNQPSVFRGDIDFVFTSPRQIDRDKAILVLGSGFGGNNVAVVIGTNRSAQL
jgi:3-oxoacyl-[acyl-carrier-protein] synthase II